MLLVYRVLLTISVLMSALRPTCPRCGSDHTVKNGFIHNKKPKYQCQDCRRPEATRLRLRSL